MKREAAEILKDALALPTEARATLAEALIASLDGQPDDDAEAAWKNEIERRTYELDAGLVSPIPWREVRRRIFERARRRALRRLRDGLDLQWSPGTSRDDVHRR